jgi:hypothetical protein
MLSLAMCVYCSLLVSEEKEIEKLVETEGEGGRYDTFPHRRSPGRMFLRR